MTFHGLSWKWLGRVQAGAPCLLHPILLLQSHRFDASPDDEVKKRIENVFKLENLHSLSRGHRCLTRPFLVCGLYVKSFLCGGEGEMCHGQNKPTACRGGLLGFCMFQPQAPNLASKATKHARAPPYISALHPSFQLSSLPFQPQLLSIFLLYTEVKFLSEDL